MDPRIPARVDDQGRLVPLHPERTLRLRGRDVWITVHRKAAPMLRSDQANKYLWGVCYATLASETGNDPESIHYGCKREAVRVGVLEPQYILLGDKLIEDDPTTRTDADTFARYVDWLRQWAEHDLGIHIPEPGEGDL